MANTSNGSGTPSQISTSTRENDRFFEHVRSLAYASRCREDGHDLDNWLLAEQQVRRWALRPLAMLIIAACLFLSRPIAAQEQYVDGNHQETWSGVQLHACPLGYSMVGANIKDNKFTCQRMVPKSEESQVHSVLDSGTQKDFGRGNMHVCPEGTYMRGLHSAQNELLCSSAPTVRLTSPFYDASGHTQSNGMHMCPVRLKKQTVMIGIHEGRNDFACAFK